MSDFPRLPCGCALFDIPQGVRADGVSGVVLRACPAHADRDTAALRARVARLREALEDIADTDYRGNHPHESALAFRALETDK